MDHAQGRAKLAAFVEVLSEDVEDGLESAVAVSTDRSAPWSRVRSTKHPAARQGIIPQEDERQGEDLGDDLGHGEGKQETRAVENPQAAGGRQGKFKDVAIDLLKVLEADVQARLRRKLATTPDE